MPQWKKMPQWNIEHKKKQIIIDIDGVLTKEISGHDYENRTPNLSSISALKDWERRGFNIILHSSRYPTDRKVTEKWLNKYNVPYNKLELGKPQGKIFDDESTNQLDKEVLLMSGGLDSTIAYWYLEKPYSLWIDIGQKYKAKEKEAVKNLKRRYDINIDFIKGLDLSQFEKGENAYIPRRNALLLQLASYYGNKLFLVGIEGDNVEDKSPEAFQEIENCLNFISKEKEDKQIKIRSPFWGLSKGEIVRWFKKNVPDAEEILLTSVSCYDKDIEWQCGSCKSCFRKAIAMDYNNMNIDWFDKNSEVVDYYIDRIDTYGYKRRKETKQVLRKWGKL